MTEKLMGTFEDVGEELIGVLSAPDIIYEANYNLLFNRPKINGVELEGDKSWADLGLDLTPYAKIEDVYSKDESDGKFALKSEIPDDFYSKAETDEKIGAVEMTAVQALNTGSYANQRIDSLGDIYYTKAAAESFNRSISASIVDLYDKIPTQLSQLTPDATHRTVTDEQIAEWDAKSEFDGDYNSLSNKPTIPTRVAELSDASEYAKKTEIPTDYATQDDIDTALNVPMSDVETVEGVGYDVAVSGNSAKIELVGGRTVKQAVMKSVDLGTLSWEKLSWGKSQYAFSADLQNLKSAAGDYIIKAMCSRYVATSSLNAWNTDCNKKMFGGDNHLIRVVDRDFSDAASFKSAMSGVMLTYESTEDELVSAKVDKIVGKSKWASVDLGTLEWSISYVYGGIERRFRTDDLALKMRSAADESKPFVGMCDAYPVISNTEMYGSSSASPVEGIANVAAPNIGTRLFIFDKSKLSLDAASFKKAMQGVILYYEPTDTEYADTLDTSPIPTAIQQLDGYGLSVSDEIYNYIDFERKKFVKRVASVDATTLNWYYEPQYTRLHTEDLIDRLPRTARKNWVLSGEYVEKVNGESLDPNWDKVIYNGNGWICVHDLRYTNASDFKSHFDDSNKIIYYELATPEEIDISAYLKDDVFVKADGSVIYHSDSGLDVPYRMQTGIMSKLWEVAMDKGGSAPAPSGGGMELLFEGVTSQASPADLSNIEDYHAVLISIGNPPTSDTSTRFGSNVYLVSDLLMFSLTNPKRFNTYVWGSSVGCVITQDKKVYSESSTYNYLVVYGIK